jgi:hypothetical protein
MSRTGPQQSLETGDGGRLLATHHHLHAPIREIAGESGEIQRPRVSGHEPAKADALHQA